VAAGRYWSGELVTRQFEHQSAVALVEQGLQEGRDHANAEDAHERKDEHEHHRQYELHGLGLDHAQHAEIGGYQGLSRDGLLDTHM